MLGSIEANYYRFMAKLTLEQKRLESLRRQLYGKTQAKQDHKEIKPQTKPAINFNSMVQVTKESQKNTDSDQISLRFDLTRIFIFSMLAIALQVILFLAIKNNLINFSFFFK